jgi:hypothetical protein
MRRKILHGMFLSAAMLLTSCSSVAKSASVPGPPQSSPTTAVDASATPVMTALQTSNPSPATAAVPTSTLVPSGGVGTSGIQPSVSTGATRSPADTASLGCDSGTRVWTSKAMTVADELGASKGTLNGATQALISAGALRLAEYTFPATDTGTFTLISNRIAERSGSQPNPAAYIPPATLEHASVFQASIECLVGEAKFTDARGDDFDCANFYVQPVLECHMKFGKPGGSTIASLQMKILAVEETTTTGGYKTTLLLVGRRLAVPGDKCLDPTSVGAFILDGTFAPFYKLNIALPELSSLWGVNILWNIGTPNLVEMCNYTGLFGVAAVTPELEGGTTTVLGIYPSAKDACRYHHVRYCDETGGPTVDAAKTPASLDFRVLTAVAAVPGLSAVTRVEVVKGTQGGTYARLYSGAELFGIAMVSQLRSPDALESDPRDISVVSWWKSIVDMCAAGLHDHPIKNDNDRYTLGCSD